MQRLAVRLRTLARRPAGMPSLARRLLVTVVYLAAGFVLFVLTQVGITSVGWVTMRCFDGAICSPHENTVLDTVALGWLGIGILLIAAGWRGWLWGARRRAPGA